MVFPKTVWLVIAAALLISSIGFKKYVWFISLGYGFSIAGIGILLLALYGGRLTAGTAICCVLFVLYGFRLGGYLLYREVKSSAYNSKMKTEIKDGKSMTFGVKCAIWVTCALLYVLQVTPVFYRLANGTGTGTASYIGAVIMLCGVGCMSWYRKNRFDNSLKSNWTAQLINTAAQGALLLGILFL